MGPLPPETTHGPAKLAALGAVCVLAISGVWWQSSARHAELTVTAPAPERLEAPTELPTTLVEAWSTPVLPAAAVTAPTVVGSVVVTQEPDGQTLIGRDPSTGAQLWRYARTDREFCAVTTAFQRVQAIARGPRGCGEITQLTPEGTYAQTFSGRGDEEIATASSTSRLVRFGRSALSVHRDDLVETLSYGDDPEPQEPGMQPHSGCVLQSAGTRREVLALVDQCEGDPSPRLRILSATPEDRRKPEEKATVALPAGGVVVAVDAAAIAVLTGDGELLRVSPQGDELSRTALPRPVHLPESPVTVHTTDAPHVISAWVDGMVLLLRPDTLDLLAAEEALGPGVPVGTELLLAPTTAGFRAFDAATGQVRAEVPVARRDTTSPAWVAWGQGLLIEQQGEELRAYRP